MHIFSIFLCENFLVRHNSKHLSATTTRQQKLNNLSIILLLAFSVKWFLIFNLVSSLMCYQDWFPLHKHFCSNLQKRLNPGNSYFYVYLQPLIAGNECCKQIFQKMLKRRRHDWRNVEFFVILLVLLSHTFFWSYSLFCLNYCFLQTLYLGVNHWCHC